MPKTFKALLNKNQELKRESNLETENQRLREKIESFENGETKEISLIRLNEIKLTSNIRDEYDFEQIEVLALDILENGQLQPVLLTKDNYLLAGYRRFNAIMFLQENINSLILPEHLKEKKIPEFVVGYRLDINFDELNPEQVDLLQYSENEQRRSLDNFQLSKLFNKYASQGYDQTFISEKFHKSKTFISAVLSLKEIDPVLVKLIKEFQIFAWTKKKFTAVNLQSVTEIENTFYEKNRGVIGWKTLYEIAKQPDIISQKKAFLRFFKSRLSQEELESDYFRDALREEFSIDEKKMRSIFKSTKSLSNAIKNAGENLPEDILSQLKQNLLEIESILENFKR